jgi:hypothetical protein
MSMCWQTPLCEGVFEGAEENLLSMQGDMTWLRERRGLAP